MAKTNKSRHNNRSSPGSAASDSGLGTNHKQRGAMDISTALQEAAAKAASEAASSRTPSYSSIWQKIYAERQGISWILVCSWIGWILGFGIGTGHLTGGAGPEVSPWRVSLGAKIRATTAFQKITFQATSLSSSNDLHFDLRNDPSHPRVFSVLREAVIREESGYVHPDLGFMLPAPSGAARGLGMIRSSFQQCQSRCMPGMWMEKLNAATENQTTQFTGDNNILYMQEEVLLKIPLNFQITRTVAITTLNAIIPADHHRRQTLQHLDDAALIVMLLAHERGLSKASRWLPYIASLPANPSCGYSIENRPYMMDAIHAMEGELGLEVQGWKAALGKVGKYADTIATSLATDYGVFLKTPEGITILDNLKWALCHVASRATAGSDKHGTLRLVPIMDLINHDASAGPFVELTGKEKMSQGQKDFIDATEDDSGTFVIRSLRHGRRKPLKRGQELMANYNVPGYSPLDWFVSMGFVPPERWHKWQKIEPALPRLQNKVPLIKDTIPVSTQWLKSRGGTLDNDRSTFNP